MSDLCPVAVQADPTVIVEPQPDSVLDSHLLLLEQQRLCDVVFTFPNSTERIQAHQLYLRERSPVFDDMFQTPIPSATGGKWEVEIADATAARFWEFLEFIYADELQVSIAGALDLLHLALKYKVEPLAKQCEAIIKTEVRIEEALEVYEAAFRYGKPNLMEKAGDLLAKHVDALWPKLMEAQEFTLNNLFRRDDLSVKECDVFTFLLKWANSRPGGENDWKGALKNLIYLVRYTSMTLNEFTTLVVPSGVLTSEEIVQIYSFFGSDPAARFEIGKRMSFRVASRRAATYEKSVWFCLKPTKPFCHNGKEPFKECMSFMASIGQNISPNKWCQISIKRPAIKGIFIRWPFRSVLNSTLKDEALKFKVAINWCKDEWCVVQDDNLQEGFSRKLAQSPEGMEEEVAVEPPIELINGIKYFITVEDSSQHARAPTFNNASLKFDHVKFSYCAPDYSTRIKHSPVINFEKWPVELRDIERNSNVTGFGNYPRLQVVAGVRIALV